MYRVPTKIAYQPSAAKASVSFHSRGDDDGDFRHVSARFWRKVVVSPQTGSNVAEVEVPFRSSFAWLLRWGVVLLKAWVDTAPNA